MTVKVVCANCGYENSSNRKTCKNCRQVLIASSNTEAIIKASTSIAEFKYLIIPFIGKLKRGVFDMESASNVSTQLQELIDQYSSQGWDFYRIDKVNILVQPGCLASLFGVKAEFLTFDQVIFRSLLS